MINLIYRDAVDLPSIEDRKMKMSIVLVLLLSAATALADEVKIIETPDGITAEYNGSSTDTINEKAVPSANNSTTPQARNEYLASQIERLKNEISELTKPVDIETQEQLADTITLVEEKQRQITLYEDELRQLNDPSSQYVVRKPRKQQQKEATDQVPDMQGSQINPQNDHQGVKQ